MANFVKIHGLTVAENGYIENAMVESLASDPSTSSPGRAWFNTTEKLFKFTTLNESGAVIVRSFTSKEDFDAHIAAIASIVTDSSGTSHIGYDGQSGALGSFSISAGALDGALDTIVDQLDANTKEISDLGNGNLPAMQSEIDTTQTGAGLETNGSYAPETGASYIASAISLMDADVKLDTQLKTVTDELAQELIDRAAADDLKVDKAGDSMTGSLDMTGNKISNILDPVDPQDAATKNYVDAVKTGLDVKDSVRAATDENIVLTGLFTVDGVMLAENDRVLVQHQTDATQNGIYDARSGDWVRSIDADGTPANEVTPGMYTFVEEGTKFANGGFVLSTTGDIMLGTSELAFSQFSGAGQVIAGAGIAKDGNELFINFGAGIIELPGDEVGIDLLPSGGLFMTENGTASSTGSDARIGIELDGETLTLSPDGLKVADNTIQTITNAQAEIDNIESNIGLAETGIYVPDAEANYTSSASTMFQSIQQLDTKLKIEEDALDQEQIDRAAADVALQAELDATQAGAGLGTDGTYTAPESNYLGSASTLFNATTILDGTLKGVADDLNAETIARGAAVTALQSELDTSQLGAGLQADGTYTANGSSDYIATAVSLFDADVKLDVALKAANDAIIAEAAARGAADTALQAELDLTQTAAGLNADGTYTADVLSNYLTSVGSLFEADQALDTKCKSLQDEVDQLQLDLNGSVFTYHAGEIAMQHSITHGLTSENIDVSVWVLDDDGKYRNDLVGITIEDSNTVTVDLTEARVIKAVVRAAANV